MDPLDAVNSIERTLRTIVAELNPQWISTLGERQEASISRSMANDSDAREGVLASADPIQHTYTPALFGVITDDYATYEPVLGDETRMRGFLSFVLDVRNTVAHGRDLTQFERDLLSGIAGQLTNQLAIWRTRNDAPNRHYPLIVTTRDSFGRVGMQLESYESSPPRVTMGDEVQLELEAVGARGRELNWYVGVYQFPYQLLSRLTLDELGSPGFHPIATGESVTVAYKFGPDDVRESAKLMVLLKADSQWHRHEGYDDARAFWFAVSPPDDE